MAFNWTCPCSDRDTTITALDRTIAKVDLAIENSEGYRSLTVEFIVCPNLGCKKFTLRTFLYAGDLSYGVVRAANPEL